MGRLEYDCLMLEQQQRASKFSRLSRLMVNEAIYNLLSLNGDDNRAYVIWNHAVAKTAVIVDASMSTPDLPHSIL